MHGNGGSNPRSLAFANVRRACLLKSKIRSDAHGVPYIVVDIRNARF